MASVIDLLNKQSVIKMTDPKKVFLPNGDVSHVTPTGTSDISARSILTNVLHISISVQVLVSKETKQLVMFSYILSWFLSVSGPLQWEGKGDL